MPDVRSLALVERATVRYGDIIALDDVNLVVGEGETVALLGPSGCGKTTLLRVISGAIVTSGRCEVHGRIGIVYQDLKLLPWLSVIANVLLGLPPDPARRAEAIGLLATAGVAGKAEAYPYTLSGGQRQRVALVRALVRGADLLLLDEPFSALDFLARRTLIDVLLRVTQTGPLSVVLVTHHLEDAMALADRLVVMRDGQIVGNLKNCREPQAAAALRAEIMSLYTKGNNDHDGFG